MYCILFQWYGTYTQNTCTCILSHCKNAYTVMLQCTVYMCCFIRVHVHLYMCKSSTCTWMQQHMYMYVLHVLLLYMYMYMYCVLLYTYIYVHVCNTKHKRLCLAQHWDQISNSESLSGDTCKSQQRNALHSNRTVQNKQKDKNDCTVHVHKHIHVQQTERTWRAEKERMNF